MVGGNRTFGDFGKKLWETGVGVSRVLPRCVVEKLRKQTTTRCVLCASRFHTNVTGQSQRQKRGRINYPWNLSEIYTVSQAFSVWSFYDEIQTHFDDTSLLQHFAWHRCCVFSFHQLSSQSCGLVLVQAFKEMVKLCATVVKPLLSTFTKSKSLNHWMRRFLLSWIYDICIYILITILYMYIYIHMFVQLLKIELQLLEWLCLATSLPTT